MQSILKQLIFWSAGLVVLGALMSTADAQRFRRGVNPYNPYGYSSATRRNRMVLIRSPKGFSRTTRDRPHSTSRKISEGSSC